MVIALVLASIGLYFLCILGIYHKIAGLGAEYREHRTIAVCLTYMAVTYLSMAGMLLHLAKDI